MRRIIAYEVWDVKKYECSLFSHKPIATFWVNMHDSLRSARNEAEYFADKESYNGIVPILIIRDEVI